MKKKQTKGLKKLSELLPMSKEIVRYSIIKKGYEFSIEEIETAGIDIEAEKEYVQKGKYKIVDVDHFNRLKKAFARNKQCKQMQRKVELINLIINLKSNYLGNAYHNVDFRTQLRHLLKGTKSWSGDVLFFFEKTCSLLTASPSHVRSYYGLSKNEDFFIDYIEWVDKNNKKMNAIFEHMQLEEVSKEIMQVAQKGEKGFWSNILNFLFAFLMIFKKKAAIT